MKDVKVGDPASQLSKHYHAPGYVLSDCMSAVHLWAAVECFPTCPLLL